jgi:hypothetical protein
METLITTIVRDGKIESLKKELNQLLIEKFVDELTFEDISFQKVIHPRTKISYTRMYVRIPECRVNKIDKLKNKMVGIYLGKSSNVDSRILLVSQRVILLNLMKENIIKKFLNK